MVDWVRTVLLTLATNVHLRVTRAIQRRSVKYCVRGHGTFLLLNSFVSFCHGIVRARLKTSSPAVTSLQVDKFMIFLKDFNFDNGGVKFVNPPSPTPLETELSNRRWGLIVNDKNIILCRRGGGQWTYDDGPDQWRGHSWGDCGSKSGGDPRSGPHYHFSLSKVCACALNIFNHYAMILQIAISQQMKFRVPVVGSATQ